MRRSVRKVGSRNGSFVWLLQIGTGVSAAVVEEESLSEGGDAFKRVVVETVER